MKKVSAKEFFTVLWSGVCQFLGWLFGLFGYKREGKFAKCVWGVFATSAAIIVSTIAIIFIYLLSDEATRWYNRQHFNCRGAECWASTRICGDIYIHDHNGKPYVFNKRTGEKLIKNIEWIAEPNGKDSLVCFSNGKKRGYFSKYTGKVVIEPKYDHAWIFSEGLACVDEGGSLKFIDATGKVVIDKKMAYSPDAQGYVFHHGYCAVASDDGERYGMIDKTGKMVLPQEYSFITRHSGPEMWSLKKGEEMAVLDKELKTIIPPMECSILIDEGTIDVTMPDHTIRKYDMQGVLIHDFYIVGVRMLEYETEDFASKNTTHQEKDYDGEIKTEIIEELYHPNATAKLRAYIAGDGYEGLMTADGHVVTMPLYNYIEAIGKDLYLCTTTNYDKVIVDGKGSIVK